MHEAEAVAVVEKAIQYVLLMANSSGEDNGERELVLRLSELVVAITDAVVGPGKNPCEQCRARGVS